MQCKCVCLVSGKLWDWILLDSELSSKTTVIVFQVCTTTTTVGLRPTRASIYRRAMTCWQILQCPQFPIELVLTDLSLEVRWPYHKPDHTSPSSTETTKPHISTSPVGRIGQLSLQQHLVDLSFPSPMFRASSLSRLHEYNDYSHHIR